MEGGLLVLWDLLDLAVQLRCRGLVYAALMLKMVGADSLKDAEDTRGINIGSELRSVEADLDMRLCREIVYLSRLDETDKLDKRHGVCHVGIMEMEMWRALKMGYTLTVID